MEDNIQYKHRDNYLCLLNEAIHIKDIMMLLDCGQPKATDIYHKVKLYCIENDIETYSPRGVPPYAFLKVVNRSIDYYYDKMEMEKKAYDCSKGH